MDQNDLDIIQRGIKRRSEPIEDNPRIITSEDTEDLNRYLNRRPEEVVTSPNLPVTAEPENTLKSDIAKYLERRGSLTPETHMSLLEHSDQEHVIPNSGNDFNWEDVIKGNLIEGNLAEGWHIKGERRRPPEGEYWLQQGKVDLREWMGGRVNTDKLIEKYAEPYLDSEGNVVHDAFGQAMYRMRRRIEEGPDPRIIGRGVPSNPIGSLTDIFIGNKVANLDNTINDIMHGDPVAAQEAFFGLLENMAWWVPEMMGAVFGPIEQRAMKSALEGVHGIGKVTDQMVNEALKKTLPGPGQIEILKREFLTGHATPRKVIKFLDKVFPTALKPKIIKQNIWENFTVPLTETLKQGVNLRVLPTPWEKDIRWKSLAEVWQPAIERAHAKGMGEAIRTSVAKRQLNTAAGENILAVETLQRGGKARMDIMREMSGMKTSNPDAKAVKRGFTGELTQQGMTWDYLKNLNKWLGKSFEDLEKDYLKDPIAMKQIDRYLNQIDTVLAQMEKPWYRKKGKHIQRTIETVIEGALEDPILPSPVKRALFDIHDLPFTLAGDVAKASRKASTTWMVEALKKRPDIVSTKKFGDSVLSNFPGLKGLWVDRDVELELRAMKAIPEMSQKMYNKLFMSPWKSMKVIMRPATHFRNIMSNAILNDWGGLPWYRWDYYVRSAKELGRRGPLWREFSNHTGGGGTFSTSEVEMLNDALKLEHTGLDTFLHIFHENWYTRNMRGAYNAEEQWFKLAKYMWNRDHGMGTKEAALDAMKWTFNYGEITRTTAGMRQYVAPFFTWQSKVLPLMAETAVKHPVRFFKWPMMLWGMQQVGMMSQNISDEEWNGIEAVLPDYIRDGQFGLMPWRDAKGRLQLLNFTYIMPGLGDIVELSMDPAGSIFGSPLITLGGALTSKTRYSGAPLYNEWDDAGTKVQRALGYIYKNLVPGLTVWPGSVNWDKMMETINNDPNALTWGQIFAAEAGLKLQPLNMEKLARQRIALDKIWRSEMVRDLQKKLRQTEDPEKRKRALLKFNAAMERQNYRMMNESPPWQPAMNPQNIDITGMVKEALF